MNRKIMTMILLLLLCLPSQLLTTSYAGTASSFLLTTDKPDGGKVVVTLKGKDIKDLYGYEAKFTFDPAGLELVESKSSLAGFSVSPIIKKNEITIAHTKIGNVTGESGDIVIGTLTFKIKKSGTSTIKWESMMTVDHNLSAQTYPVGKSVSVSSTEKGFIDLLGHWAKADIELLASKGIIKGIDQEHFAPENQVTRAEFAALISRALNLKTDTKESPFTDVAPASWYRDVINSAYSAGIIQGLTETKFAPEQNITREEMAVMIVRAKTYASGSSTDGNNKVAEVTFADSADISKWAREGVQTAARSGIIKGKAGLKFDPQGKASRAEAATVIKRLLSDLSLL